MRPFAAAAGGSGSGREARGVGFQEIRCGLRLRPQGVGCLLECAMQVQQDTRHATVHLERLSRHGGSGFVSSGSCCLVTFWVGRLFMEDMSAAQATGSSGGRVSAADS